MLKINLSIIFAISLMSCAVKAPEQIKIGEAIFYVDSEEISSSARLLKGKKLVGSQLYYVKLFVANNCINNNYCYVSVDMKVDLSLREIERIMSLLQQRNKTCQSIKMSIVFCPSDTTLKKITFENSSYIFWYGVLSGHPGDGLFPVEVKRFNGGFKII